MKSNVRTLDLVELRSRIADFEHQYGVRSERLYDAFTVNGVLRETNDMAEWSLLYTTVQRLQARRAVR